ncbi:hypothetical protein SELMODRAFT_403605 [Selaginella moellendorffii]|uniref:Uncharacterized protein n=1 Tax=Selaginella moellendorffii TaxID=88036 RepID=D8QRY1_SELML|nr:hypothetical protein SELMODRAFT_403605 [Selaginella moellendorffii]
MAHASESCINGFSMEMWLSLSSQLRITNFFGLESEILSEIIEVLFLDAFRKRVQAKKEVRSSTLVVTKFLLRNGASSSDSASSDGRSLTRSTRLTWGFSDWPIRARAHGLWWKKSRCHCSHDAKSSLALDIVSTAQDWKELALEGVQEQELDLTAGSLMQEEYTEEVQHKSSLGSYEQLFETHGSSDTASAEIPKMMPSDARMCLDFMDATTTNLESLEALTACSFPLAFYPRMRKVKKTMADMCIDYCFQTRYGSGMTKSARVNFLKWLQSDEPDKAKCA